MGLKMKEYPKWQGNLPKYWNRMTDLSLFDYEIKGGVNPEYDMELVEMPPEDFLKISYETRMAHASPEQQVSFEKWKEIAESERLNKLVKTIKTGKIPREVRKYGTTEIPTPVIETDSQGNPLDFQEGRHRALAAIKAGMPTIPVWIAKEKEEKTKERLARKQRREDELIQKRKEDEEKQQRFDERMREYRQIIQKRRMKKYQDETKLAQNRGQGGYFVHRKEHSINRRKAWRSKKR